MPFRDRPPRCPRCQLDLQRVEAVEERWACRRCRGAAVGDGAVVAALLEVAPDLMPDGGVAGVGTMGRGRATPLPCARCGHAMEPGFLGAIEIDRCRADALFWFDDAELERVLARAAAQRDERQSTLARRLRALL